MSTPGPPADPLARLIGLCLRHRAAVIFAALALVAVGLDALRRLPFDAYPDTTPPQVQLNTVAAALSPLDIERQITAPLEQAISGLPGLVEVRSISKFGFSQITAQFDEGTDIYLARQVVTERVAPVTLPDGVEPPTLGPVSTGLGEVFQYLVESQSLSAAELRTLHHWVIRPQMLQTPGVAEINTWGGYEKQHHVVFDPEKLLAHDLTLDDVADALRRNNRNAGGGIVEQGGEGRVVQGIGLLRPADIGRVVIAARDGVPIRVEDVARVEEGHQVRRGAVTAEGRGEAVLGLGFMLMGHNSHALTQALDARLDAVRQTLPEGVSVTPVYRRTDLVDAVLETVQENLFEGALFVVAVLFALLGSLRAGLIVAVAIPLSMLFAFDGMLRLGIAGSLMSLGAIDFGLVVDSSVIMVENAARRVDEDQTGRPLVDIVRDAAVEVRRPTLFGELIIAIVYLPILTLEGIEGQLFRPMALTVLLALGGSMIISLTLMPVLASFALARRSGRHREPWLLRGLQRVYRAVLDRVLKHRAAVIAVAALLLGNAAWLATTLGSAFVPRLMEQAVVVNTVRLAGVSLTESVRYGTQIERLLLQRYPDEIAHIWTRTGTAEVATDPMGIEVSDVFMTLHPRARWTRAETQDALMAAISADLEQMPGMRAILTQPIELRMNEITAGVRADLGIKLFGDDFQVLEILAGQVQGIVEQIPGAAGVTVDQLTGQPVMQVTVDRDAIARHGIDADRVLTLVETLGVRPVGEIIEGQRRFDLALRLDDRYRADPRLFEALLVPAPDGQRIPLGELARIERVEAPSTVTREWGRRRIAVQANVRGRDIGSFVAEVRAALDRELVLPPGYAVTYGGQFEHLEGARDRLLVVVPLALLLVFGLLYISFGALRDALLVFSGVPFAAIGGIVALVARGLPFSISAAVGFIALAGVAVLGQLVLVARIRQLMDRGTARHEAVRRAATTRLRAVLTTALVAALGFVPMAINTGIGAEIQRPLATVVIGGILTSLLATLILLPALYDRFGPPDRAPRAST